MSAQQDTAHESGKGSFRRAHIPGANDRYRDNYDAIFRKNRVLISGDELDEYIKSVERELGEIPDGLVSTLSTKAIAQIILETDAEYERGEALDSLD